MATEEPLTLSYEHFGRRGVLAEEVAETEEDLTEDEDLHSNESMRLRGQILEQPGPSRQRVARRQGVFWFITAPYPNAWFDALPDPGTPWDNRDGITWVKGQREKGHGTGFEHYQAVLGFDQKVSLAGVTRVLGTGIHAELTRSRAAEAYCVKEDTRVGQPFEFGAKPFRRNSKTDWNACWNAATVGDLMQIPANVRIVSYNSLRRIQSDYSLAKVLEKRVEVFWGATGTGKSRRAWDEAGEGAFPKCPRSKFWDGYQTQSNVIIDEFRGGIDISHLLRWFDRYPVRVEVKGSSRPFYGERIWITSNISPDEWYPLVDPETMKALKRRLNVTYFPPSMFSENGSQI